MQWCGVIKAFVAGWAGRPSHHSLYMPIKVPHCDPGTLMLHLPSFVGGMANSVPQLLCRFLWGEVRLGTGGDWAQRASVACEWSSFLV